MIRRKPLVAAVSGAAAIALLAACSSSGGGGSTSSGSSSPTSSASSSAQVGNVVNPGFTTKGGTVQVLDADGAFEHLDPVENYVTNTGELGKLIYRTLTVIDDTPGQTPKVEPDIASALGTTSDGGKTWTWPLRSGLKYEDGTTITSADIKYDIERDFDRTTYPDGASYMADLLDAPSSYTGPYTSGDLPNSVVDASDPNKLTVKFKSDQPDANWIMSLDYTAPVPKAKDTKKNYDLHPISSGPYKIQSYNPAKELVLVRNPYWDSSTDPNRTALPNEFDFTIGISLPTISQRLIASQGTDVDAVTLENSGALQSGDVAKVAAPSVRSRFVNGPTPCVDYEWINTQKVTDPSVRKAISLAINRQAIVTAYGGSLFGSLNNSIISPTINAYSPLSDSALGLMPTGNPSAAKAALAGKTVPTITYGVASSSVKQKTVATEIQNDLKAIGVNLSIVQIPSSSYYTTIRSNAAPDMGRAGWCWDWPTSAAIVPPVLGPDPTGKTWGDSNFSKYFDPTISAQITSLANSTASDVPQKFNDLTNQIISTEWPLLPTVTDNDPQVVGSAIQNAGVSTVFGEIDLTRIGVKT